MNACVQGAWAGQGCCVEAVIAAASPVTSAWVKMFSTLGAPFLSAESTSLVSKRKDDSKRSL